MTQCHLHSIKASNLSVFESYLLLFAIVLIISSLMCLIIAAIALFLPNSTGAMFGLLVASIILGAIGFYSLKSLQNKPQ